MLMQRRARYRLGSVYEIINNRVSPVAIIFTSTLLSEIHSFPGLYPPPRYIRGGRDSAAILSPRFFRCVLYNNNAKLLLHTEKRTALEGLFQWNRKT